ncbi:MAG: PRC and DUF2382 domain-containing protein [Opitutaceae bacterium]|nr:PRC and DUF2382 domain-containing protein [Opitutaceae bacterium]
MNEKTSQQYTPDRDTKINDPGSHPVGTGAGAVAGGALGAAVGSGAGPVGTAVGAVAGGVVGAFTGHATAEAVDSTSELGDMSRFIDYDIITRTGDKVGSVDAVWEDHTGQPYYLAVKTGWLGLGKAHIVPAHQAEVSDSRRTIRLPFTEEQIKNAPTLDSQEDVTEDSDRTIQEYFGIDHLQTASVAEAYADEDSRDSSQEDSGTGLGKSSSEEAHITLNEEELKVGKREVEAGGIRLRKVIRTEVVNRPVELRREEIVIERTPATSATAVNDQAEISDDEIYIPLRREEVVIEKSVRPREEVRIGKREYRESENVNETIRSEELEVEDIEGRTNDGGTRPRDYVDTR